MLTKISIPNIGEDELEVTEIMVKIGDNVDINQSLLVIEGDKSSIEIPSPYSGTINEIYIHIGDKVHTGLTIFSIITNIHHPHTIENTEKQYSNTKLDSIINDINTKNDIIHNNIDKNTKSTTINSPLIYATPLIRQMAHALEIDLSKIQGSGRKGRILKEDIQHYLHSSIQHHNASNTVITPTHSSLTSQIKTDFNAFGDTTTIKLKKIQKTSGTKLQKSWSMLPHVTQFDIADITDLENFRQQQNLKIEKNKKNYKITLLVFIMKVVAKALETLPYFNSSLSQTEDVLILKKYINIGIAVDTTKGLLVPVIYDVNKKTIIELSKELSQISQQARSMNQICPINTKGGTFTISNLGSIGGGTGFTPIINFPEVAILGISRSSIQPKWNGKTFIPRLMLPLSLSYDHRVINGADGAKFMNLIIEIISDIRLLSI